MVPSLKSTFYELCALNLISTFLFSLIFGFFFLFLQFFMVINENNSVYDNMPQQVSTFVKNTSVGRLNIKTF